MSPNVLFCPQQQKYTVYCQRGLKKPEHIHILEAVIYFWTLFLLKKWFKRINRLIFCQSTNRCSSINLYTEHTDDAKSSLTSVNTPNKKKKKNLPRRRRVPLKGSCQRVFLSEPSTKICVQTLLKSGLYMCVCVCVRARMSVWMYDLSTCGAHNARLYNVDLM